MAIALLFNPKPAAQADRRPVDLFDRCQTSSNNVKDDDNRQTVNDASGSSATPHAPLLFEARLNAIPFKES